MVATTDNAAGSSDVSFNELPASQPNKGAVRAHHETRPVSPFNKRHLQWRKPFVQYTLFSAVISAKLQPQSELN
jgi:hypothetical protein